MRHPIHKLLLAVLILVFLSCTEKNESLSKVVIGSWSFCDNDGDYTELYFTDEMMFYYYSSKPPGVKFFYSTFGDTLLLYRGNIKDRRIVSIIDNDNLILSSDDLSKDEIHLKRFETNVIPTDDYVDHRPENNFSLLFNERKENSECVDKEPKIKIPIRDSINFDNLILSDTVSNVD